MNYKKFLLGALTTAALVTVSANQAKAATNETATNGVLKVTYQGPGSVNLLDNNGHYMNQYVKPNTAWKVFAKATINGTTMYRIGSQKQWIPAKYISLKPQTNSSDSSNSATDITSISGVATVTYAGPGNVRLLDNNGRYMNQYVKRGSAWKVNAQATINGLNMYRIGSNKQWIPAKYVSFTNKNSNTDSKNGYTKVHVFSPSEILQAKQRFVDDVNNWRQSQGVPKLAYSPNSWMSAGSNVRAEDNKELELKWNIVGHIRADGSDYWASAFSKPDNMRTEVLGINTSGGNGWGKNMDPISFADFMFDQMVYHDEASNWGHRDALIKDYGPGQAIGMGIASFKTNNGEISDILVGDMGFN